MTLKLNYKRVRRISIYYIVLPIIVFFLGWLKLYLAVPFSFLLLTGTYFLLKADQVSGDETISIPIKHFIAVLLIFAVWVWLSGAGGFFYQTSDNHWRNAVFRDLIDYPWPVKYPLTGNGLVYYLMYWITPALIGKIFGWTIANIALFCIDLIGITLVYLLLVHIGGSYRTCKLYAICFILIFFSGLDQFGMAFMDILGKANYSLSGYEGWTNSIIGYQYSSNNTLLSWVYNQTIVPWIALCFLFEKPKVSSFAFIGLCVLPYAPFPFLGLLIYFMAYGVIWVIPLLRKKRIRFMIKEILSLPNILASITIFPTFLAYFSCNVNTGHFGLTVPLSRFNYKWLLLIILFYILEVGIYLALLFKQNRKNALYWVTSIALFFIPFFKLGHGMDFCMRVSLPFLLFLQILIIQFFTDKEPYWKRQPVAAILLIMTLTLGGYNEFADDAAKFKEIYQTKQFPIVADDIKTFSDKQVYDPNVMWTFNFLCPIDDGKIFYKYFAK